MPKSIPAPYGKMNEQNTAKNQNRVDGHGREETQETERKITTVVRCWKFTAYRTSIQRLNCTCKSLDLYSFRH